MNQMEIFKNPEFGTIRAVEIDGEPWLVGKDVALALGYKNPQEAIRNHVDAEDKGVSEILTPGGMQKLPIINESGLYSLVLSSKLPKAKQFRRWVTSEVLPSIRQHGAYLTRDKLWEVATSPEALLKLCTDLLTEREKNAALREDNAPAAKQSRLLRPVHRPAPQYQPAHHRQGAGRAGAALCPLPAGTAICLPHSFRLRAALRQSANDGLFCVRDYYRNGHTGSYTLVTPKGKLHFAGLRDLILVTV